MSSSSFGFLIFCLDSFIKVLVVFNFIIQFKLMILYFLIWSSLFSFQFFFLSPFCKSYHSFQSLNLITILFLFFMSILILISFFFYPSTKLIFFNFTIQLNIKFILYFIFLSLFF